MSPSPPCSGSSPHDSWCASAARRRRSSSTATAAAAKHSTPNRHLAARLSVARVRACAGSQAWCYEETSDPKHDIQMQVRMRVTGRQRSAQIRVHDPDEGQMQRPCTHCGTLRVGRGTGTAKGTGTELGAGRCCDQAASTAPFCRSSRPAGPARRNSLACAGTHPPGGGSRWRTRRSRRRRAP